jgi:hypothetical protein
LLVTCGIGSGFSSCARYRRQEQENEEQTSLSEKQVNKPDVNPNSCNVLHGLEPSYFFFLQTTILVTGGSDSSTFLCPRTFPR